MKFNLKLKLTERQKHILYKIGYATKIVYNNAIYQIEKYYEEKGCLCLLYELQKIIFGEKTQYMNMKTIFFNPTLCVAIGSYKSYLKTGNHKPYEKDVNDFSYSIYLDNSCAKIFSDYLELKTYRIFSNLEDISDTMLVPLLNGKQDLSSSTLFNLKITYDGLDYFASCQTKEKREIDDDEVLIKFLGDYFISTNTNLKIPYLTDNESFMKKIMIVKDLEKTINNKVKNKEYIYDAEYSSLDFTKKQVKDIMSEYVDKVIKELLLLNPKKISTNYIDYTKYQDTLNDRINNFLTRYIRRKIKELCAQCCINFYVKPKLKLSLSTKTDTKSAKRSL